MILYSKWTSLPLPVRNDIAKVLGITKTGTTHVDSNRIVSDGYAINEVERGLAIENVQTYLGTKEKDPDVLWTMLMVSIYPLVEVQTVAVEAPIVPGSVAHSMAQPERPAHAPKKKSVLKKKVAAKKSKK